MISQAFCDGFRLEATSVAHPLLRSLVRRLVSARDLVAKIVCLVVVCRPWLPDVG